ncbi:AHH domain-containing protein [Archangium violaceum]|uniref:AHH domain-containing protein n=1 Tax=Archangium violaceum TaxID=83451 RepID=UPI002B2B6CB1|nr:AHH domain-containing protein [Archangium gephyra]
MLLRGPLAFRIVLVVAVTLVLRAAPAEAAGSMPPSGVVAVRELPGRGLALVFEPLARAPGLEQLAVGDARRVLDIFREDLVQVRTTGLHEEYLSRYGEAAVTQPPSLVSGRLIEALRRSPRYMKAGVREAAAELFSDPLFLAGVSTSVVAYFLAWAVPEPLFSKSFAVTVSVGLVLAFGVMELRNLGLACLRLYEDAEKASTPEELEAVAERFGKAMGGTALRALVMVASAGVSKGLPKVPEGGLWRMLAPRRYALPEGLTMGTSTTVRAVADGTVVLMSAAVGTASSSSRVTGACGDGSKKDGHWHHIATNKNDTCDLRGGPWTPVFKKLFDQAGMSLDDSKNRIYLQGHKGPHPEEYHAEIFEVLQRAMKGCQGQSACRSMLVGALDKLAGRICTPGSQLHELLTKKS